MRRLLSPVALVLVVVPLAGCGDERFTPPPPPVTLLVQGDQPACPPHMKQSDLETGAVSLATALERGQTFFVASFNALDGGGRPESTGTGGPRDRREGAQGFNRISGPDANACSGCHNLPAVGGGGDNVANVFVLGQRFPFVDFEDPPGEGDGFQQHTLRQVANERNTLGMAGSGYVELLAREMTTRLQALRAEGLATAQSSGTDVAVPLSAKGVSFGSLTARPDGTVDASAVEGVDADLVVRPFHQKGVVVSLREFTNNAMNHHHGMQSVERFGEGLDPDGDGVVDELTVGDVTNATLFQALLPPPGRVLPPDAAGQAAVARGEASFHALGCAVCHVPALRLDDPVFSEPGPFNPPGNLRLADVAAPILVDLSAQGPAPRLPEESDGSVLVPLYSDLKRHDLGPALDTEALIQAGVPTRMWLTRKLWGFASEPPYLHHGRATLISEAILLHGGEAQASRDAFAALSPTDQGDVIDFLETLRALPEGSPDTTVLAGEPGPAGESPAAPAHLDQAALDAGGLPLEEVLSHGRALFATSFNALDGAGRPLTDGTGAPRARREAPENFNRISGPDANACSGCHNLPVLGGGGDNVANVFVLGQRFPFVDFADPPGEGDGFQQHTLTTVANERNTLGMSGSGWIEILAREMTADLHALRAAAWTEALATGLPASRDLVTKDVSFGRITARPDGTFDTSLVEGVDADLVVKPFHQKGVVPSLRVFTNNALNHHHGMQSSERFGSAVDADGDGHPDEVSRGDVTALTLFQATMAVPVRTLPEAPARRAAVDRGEALFTEVGCAACHRPTLRASSPIFREPGPYNPVGNLRPADVPAPYAVDLTADGPPPRLSREPDGSVLVPAFTDLKRHDMGPALDTERLVQAGVPTSEWLTRKLWGFASEPPFLHHGRATTIEEAILLHGGEGQASRDAYAALPEDDRRAVVDFLATLRILPEPR